MVALIAIVGVGMVAGSKVNEAALGKVVDSSDGGQFVSSNQSVCHTCEESLGKGGVAQSITLKE